MDPPARRRRGSAPKEEKREALIKPDRVHQVFQWILSGATETDIREAIQTNWPDQDASPLIVQAITRMAASAEPENRKVIKGWCIEATRSVYQKAIEISDLQTALQAIKQLSKLT